MGRLVFLAPLGVATFLFVGSLGVLIAAPASAASSGWGSPYPLEVEGRGSLKDLNVAVDANGGGFIAWIQGDARGSVWAARLLPDLGARSATPISGPGYAADLEFAVDARGNAVAAWSQDYDGTTAVYASQFDVQAKTWDAPALINPVSRLEGLTMDPGGNATIAGSQWNGDSWDLWASRLESGMEWNDPVVLAPEYRRSVDKLHVSIATDHQGRASVAWQRTDEGPIIGGPPWSIWTNRFVPGFGWGTATRLASDQRGNGPQIAMDPGGNATITWFRRVNTTQGEILASRFNGSADEWGGSTRVAPISRGGFGSFTFPRVAMDPEGNAFVVWSQGRGDVESGDVKAARFDASSGSWQAPVLIDTELGVVFDPLVAFDGNGDALAIWSQVAWGDRYSDAHGNTWGNRYEAATRSWGTASPIKTGGSLFSHQLSVSPDGRAAAVWGQRHAGQIQVELKQYSPEEGWGEPTAVRREGLKDAASPRIAIDGEGRHTVLWLQSDGLRYGVWANRFEVNPLWRPIFPPHALEVDSADAGQPRLAVNSRGETVAAWLQRDGHNWSVFASSYAVEEGGWGAPTMMSTRAASSSAGFPIRPGVTDLQIALSPWRHAIAVWTQWDGSQFNVWANTFNFASGTGGVAVPVPGGEGSSQPRVAVDADGNALAIWTQGDGVQSKVVANRFDSGTQSWGLPVTLASGASQPGLAMDPTGNAIALWAQAGDANTRSLLVSNRFVAGTGWGASTVIMSHDAGGIAEPQIVIDDDGNAVALWQQWGVGVTQWGGKVWGIRFDVSTLGWERATRFTGEESFGGAIDIAIDREGHAFAVWLELGLELRVMATRFNAGSETWETPTAIDSAGQATAWSHPQIAVDPDGNALAVWSQRDSERYRIFANRYLADTVPPSLWLLEPKEGAIVTEPTVTVTGTTEPGVALELNGIEAAVASDGSFAFLLALSEGANIITATATDDAGNVATDSVRVTYRSAIPELEQELRDIQGALDSTNEALDGTEQALASAEWRLFLFQAVFAASAVVLFVLYWNLRRRGPGPGGDLPRSKDSTRFGALRLGRKTSPTADLRKEVRLRRGVEQPRPWPRRAAGSPVRLTSKERILLHLLNGRRSGLSLEVPADQTQRGVAVEASIDLRHFAQYVRPLIQAGLVLETSAHVEGSLSRRKVYVLTQQGKERAVGIRDRVLSTVVSVQDGSQVQEAPIRDIFRLAEGARSIIDIVREVIEKGVVDLRR